MPVQAVLPDGTTRDLVVPDGVTDEAEFFARLTNRDWEHQWLLTATGSCVFHDSLVEAIPATP